jgi:hypothetical protein
MSANLHTPPVSRLKDADMRAVPAALVRAGQRAREVAARTGTPLVVSQDGVVVEVEVTPPLPVK